MQSIIVQDGKTIAILPPNAQLSTIVKRVNNLAPETAASSKPYLSYTASGLIKNVNLPDKSIGELKLLQAEVQC